MIELNSVSGGTISIDRQKVASVSVGDFAGTRIALNGGWLYYVEESYEEVLAKIKGNVLETK